jgi:protein-tyrosine phosphatase
MRFYWVESPVGRIAIAAAPDADNMIQEISNMQEEKVEFVLSLLQADEASQIGLANEELILEAAGIEFAQIPIADFGVPENGSEIDSVVLDMARYLETGGSLVVHCRGGIGRSSMVVSAILTHLGVKSNDALRHVEKARGLRVPETTAQREWVTDRDSC